MVISEEARIQRKPAVTLASRNTTSYSRIWRNYTIFFDIGEDAKTITIEPAFYQACSSGSIFLVSVIGDQFNLWTGSVSGDQLTINSASGGSGIAITAYVTISGVPL